jgi:hypothetical protein
MGSSPGGKKGWLHRLSFVVISRAEKQKRCGMAAKCRFLAVTGDQITKLSLFPFDPSGKLLRLTNLIQLEI